MRPLAIGGVRRVLVVAPHADDEAIGAFGLIRRLRARGARVRVVVVTDGAASHPASARWPKARLVAERRRETRRVLRGIGVAAGAVRFLGLPDGALAEVEPPIGKRVTRAVRSGLAGRGAALLLLPAADDDHADHRASARLAARAITPGVRRLSYGVWPPRVRAAPRPTTGLWLKGVQPMKRGAIRRYRTQTGAIRDDPAGFAISRNDLKRFAGPREAFGAVVLWRR